MGGTVSLAQRHRLARDAAAPSPLLTQAGASLVLGGTDPQRAAALRPAADTLFAPRGVAGRPDGPLVVSDTGHHRLLLWHTMPRQDRTPADLVLGQPDAAGEARNRGAAVGPLGLNVPVGVALAGEVLAVADSWNHRVLIWHGLPRTPDRAPDVLPVVTPTGNSG